MLFRSGGEEGGSRNRAAQSRRCRGLKQPLARKKITGECEDASRCRNREDRPSGGSPRRHRSAARLADARPWLVARPSRVAEANLIRKRRVSLARAARRGGGGSAHQWTYVRRLGSACLGPSLATVRAAVVALQSLFPAEPEPCPGGGCGAVLPPRSPSSSRASAPLAPSLPVSCANRSAETCPCTRAARISWRMERVRGEIGLFRRREPSSNRMWEPRT